MRIYKRIIALCILLCLNLSLMYTSALADDAAEAVQSAEEPVLDGIVMDASGRLWYMPEQIPLTFLSQDEYDVIVKCHLYTETDKVLTDNRSNAEIVWDYWYQKTGNPYGVAGLMGNISAESGFNPMNLQGTYEKNGWNDKNYTAAVDNGTYKKFANDSAGYGLVQWTYWKYKANLLKYAKSRNASVGDIYVQLDFLNAQFEGSHAHVGKALREAKSIQYASNVVLLRFECPADTGEGMQKVRASLGMKWYNNCIGRCDMLDSINSEIDVAVEHGRGVAKMLDMQYKVNVVQNDVVSNFYIIDVSPAEKIQNLVSTLLAR